MSDRIGVMDEGRLLQVGTPQEIYEHPANRFVANFIGQTNLLEGTVESPDTVCLANGARIPASSEFPAGTSVAVSLRPERSLLHRRSDVPLGRPSVDGVLEQVTYLGNALVHTVALDWMKVEVRTESQADVPPVAVGEDVSVSWEPGAVTVVSG